MGFHALTFVRSLRRCIKPKASNLVVIEGNLISQPYMDEVLRPVPCLSCVKTSDSIRPTMTLPEHILLESDKFLRLTYAVRIDWSV